MRAPAQRLLTVLVTAAIAAPLGAWLATRPPATPAAGATDPAPHLRYQCPMHPAVVRDAPDTCPICGMTLVLQQPTAPEASGLVGGRASVTLDDELQRRIGLHTTPVEVGPLGDALLLPATVSIDETRVSRVTVRVPGYVERVFVDFVGKPVRPGQPLFELSSPELMAAESEWLLAQKNGLGPAARARLELLDVPQAELERLTREGTVGQRVTYLAKRAGVVTKKELTPGSRLEAGAMAYELVDLSTVWVTAQVPEAQLRFVTAGVEGTLALTAFPGRTWSGQVRFIDPQLDPATRTVRVRLAFDNPKGELRPELFGELRLARPSRQVLQVPTDAIVPGPKPLVFVARGGGRFEPRVVTLGEATGERTEVKGGLGEGDEVVTGGLFLLDSEASLRASLRRAEAAP